MTEREKAMLEHLKIVGSAVATYLLLIATAFLVLGCRTVNFDVQDQKTSVTIYNSDGRKIFTWSEDQQIRLQLTGDVGIQLPPSKEAEEIIEESEEK